MVTLTYCHEMGQIIGKDNISLCHQLRKMICIIMPNHSLVITIRLIEKVILVDVLLM